MREDKKPDYEYWKKFDSWELEEAIYLIHGIEPSRKPSSQHEVVMARLNNRPQKHHDIQKTRHLASKSIKAGMLSLIEPTKSELKPSDFVKWAVSKNLEVPEELKDLMYITALDTNIIDAPYLNRKHEYFSEELYAAISAWVEIYNGGKFKIKHSHKVQIMKWLSENYTHFSKEAIKRVATVVNCNKRGGAPSLE